jgi:SecD/SecF fusion protein
MNGKNLPLKFAFLALAVAVCLWTLLAGNGLRQGIDLQGGHSLIFEIQASEAKINQLEQDKIALNERLAQAGTEEGKKDLQGRVAQINAEISALQQEDPADLAEEMIAILKRRVDPEGLRNLEWRPVGKNRIEIRMPAGMAESKGARRAYLDSLQKLESRNIRPSQLARLERSGPGAERDQRVEALAAGDEQLATMLADLAGTYDRMIAARAAGDDDAYQNALNDWEAKTEDVKSRNISRIRLESVLGNYISQSEAKALKNTREIQRRTETFETEMTSLLEAYPHRRETISEVAERYKAWAQVRQYLDDPEDLIRLIAKAGVLEFRIAPQYPREGDTEGLRVSRGELEHYLKSLEDEGPKGAQRRRERYQWFVLEDGADLPTDVITHDYAGRRYVLLCNDPANSLLQRQGRDSWTLKNPHPTMDRLNTPAVGFEFDEAGAQLFGMLTLTHKGHFMAILLDDEVYSAPVIQTQITDSGIISGSFSPAEVRELVNTLRAGSLPARLNPNPVARNSFGPGLGAVNRARGVRAAYVGLIAVAAFMLLYYLMSGFIADVALLLNIILVLGAMSLLSAVFTLPGIAGVILTIGIAVDANVLIFERLREEQQRGQSVRMALKNAYDRAFSAIFDANITTLITCLILGWVGTEEIRGFAITLGLGVTFSLFTALAVTRWIFQLLLAIGMLKKPVFMLHIIGVPKIDWLAKRKLFWVVSGVLIVVGVGSLISQGKGIWGIDFSSGTKAVVQFRDDALIDGELSDDAVVRERLSAAAGELGYDKLKATARVEMLLDPDQADKFLARYDTDDDMQVTLAEWKSKPVSELFFAKMDANGDGALSQEELEALPATAYQVATTESLVDRIRETTEKAFGDSLRRRRSCTFQWVRSQHVEQLGVDVPASGQVRVRPIESSRYRDLMQDYDGGLLMVVKDLSPALAIGDVEDRIREMRFQPDFEGQRLHESDIVPLAEEAPGQVTSFAMFVRPVEMELLSRSGAWQGFSEDEMKLLGASLERSEAMVATNFDAAIAGDKAQLAIVAVILSWLAIVLYLWFRFGSAQWGLAAVICLVHDVIIVVGLVALSNTFLGQWLGLSAFKIDLAMIAAILTVIGYSVNDSIVVFDRIRENRGKLATVSPQVINSSINQTLSRTLLTSGTTFIVVLIMYVWGGAGIHGFSYALLAGVIFGTYSSIAVASPLLLGFKKALVSKVVPTQE